MQYKIKNQNETLTISSKQLLELLVTKVSENANPNHTSFVQVFTDYLELSGTLKSTTIFNLLLLAFNIGYYYKVFLQKNTVEIITDESSNLT